MIAKTDVLDYLSRALCRKVSREELAVALGTSASTVDRRGASGFSIDEIVTAAEKFGLSKVATLIELDVITLADVLDAAEADGVLVATSSTALLAAEVARRLAEGG